MKKMHVTANMNFMLLLTTIVGLVNVAASSTGNTPARTKGRALVAKHNGNVLPARYRGGQGTVNLRSHGMAAAVAVGIIERARLNNHTIEWADAAESNLSYKHYLQAVDSYMDDGELEVLYPTMDLNKRACTDPGCESPVDGENEVCDKGKACNLLERFCGTAIPYANRMTGWIYGFGVATAVFYAPSVAANFFVRLADALIAFRYVRSVWNNTATSATVIYTDNAARAANNATSPDLVKRTCSDSSVEVKRRSNSGTQASSKDLQYAVSHHTYEAMKLSNSDSIIWGMDNRGTWWAMGRYSKTCSQRPLYCGFNAYS